MREKSLFSFFRNT